MKKPVKKAKISKEELRKSKGIVDLSTDTFTLNNDPVNHPSHYTHLPNGIECIDVIEHFPANIANAMKYLFRAGHKDCTTQDLAKAAWYVQRQIDLLNGNVKRMK